MRLVRIVNDLIGINERMIVAAALSEFLQCQLVKCSTVESLPDVMKSVIIVRANWIFFIRQCCMMTSMCVLESWLPTQVPVSGGFPLV
jgi:hypothetical protein